MTLLYPNFLHFSGEDLFLTGIKFTRPDTQHVVAQKGNPLVLNCTAESNATARFTWFKDGSPLLLGNQRRIQVVNGSLSFKRVVFRRKKNVTDEGEYECHVRNNIGSIIAKRVKVVIAGQCPIYSCPPPPKPPTLEAEYKINLKARIPGRLLKDSFEISDIDL